MTFKQDFIEVIREFQKLPEVSLKNVRHLMEKKQELEQENEQIAAAIIADLEKSEQLYELIKDHEHFKKVLNQSKKLQAYVKDLKDKEQR